MIGIILGISWGDQIWSGISQSHSGLIGFDHHIISPHNTPKMIPYSLSKTDLNNYVMIDTLISFLIKLTIKKKQISFLLEVGKQGKGQT